MKVPCMDVIDYLTLLDECGIRATVKAYSVTNADIRDGKVYFRSMDALRMLERLLRASETNTQPEDVQAEAKRTLKLAEQNLKDLDLSKIELLDDYANSDGYRHGRCPICYWEDMNTPHTHATTDRNFWINEETGQFSCHSDKHTSFLIVKFLKEGKI